MLQPRLEPSISYFFLFTELNSIPFTDRIKKSDLVVNHLLFVCYKCCKILIKHFVYEEFSTLLVTTYTMVLYTLTSNLVVLCGLTFLKTA